jgi:hypothetical protein
LLNQDIDFYKSAGNTTGTIFFRMPRPDLTESVIHFIKASSETEACEILCQIVQEGVLRGGSGFIKGGYVCVCLADLSASLAKMGFVNGAGNTRYTRFGVMVPKDWLFARGGRPMLYQADDEFELLPESLRWRHVTFNLGNNHVDFTWQREWRICCDWLRLDPDVVSLIVPSQAIASQLRCHHEDERDFKIRQYSQIFDEYLAEAYRRPFPWKVHILW